MSIKDEYHVMSIKKEECKEWFLYKHYAHTIPSISYSFGLYRKSGLCGVCSFGNGAMNLHKSIVDIEDVVHFELNRLVIEENHHKNLLSFFVAQSLSMLPKPCIVVSYADANQRHHGYIYQALNFIYTGETSPEYEYFDTRTNIKLHRHTVNDLYGTRSLTNLPTFLTVKKEEHGKHRYVLFLGSRSFKKKCLDAFKHTVKTYPKGENQRYDASYAVKTQMALL